MWEYKIIDSDEAEKGGFMKGRTVQQVEAYLNVLGAEGWEIVNLDFQMDLTMPGGPTHFHGLAKRPRE